MNPAAQPLLKWAGGKRQMLSAIAPHIPSRWQRYVEPMVGGGALFFALAPQRALIADSNPELINFYRTIVADLPNLLAQYGSWPFDEKTFYELRALRFCELDNVTAAARLIYLNRTCFNGLYRVNRNGDFNVPWGKYKHPYKVDVVRFEAARDVLGRARIELSDFSDLLRNEAMEDDLVFLDPPYVPISNYSDFKRYTRQQFHDADHIRMAELVRELAARGCHVLVTNSNHPLVHDLYRGYHIEVVATKRNVNSHGHGRSGEDVIINVKRS